MEKQFSFVYGETEYNFPAKDKACYELEDGVTVSVELKTYPKFNATEYVLWFENKSNKNSRIFSNINDCDSLFALEFPAPKKPNYMPKEGDPCIITMTGCVSNKYYWANDKVSAREFAFNLEYIDRPLYGKKRFENTGGRSSQEMMPFFDVTSLGSGYVMAIGWTGDWRADFVKSEGGIQVKTGLKYTNFYLEPGEKIRTTSTLIMEYTSGEDKRNKFRSLIKEHFSHTSNTSTGRESLLAFSIWGGLNSEEIKKRINELKKYDIKFEDLWIDAGWYGNCTNCDDSATGDWSINTGDWSINKRVHPGEFKDVNECAKEAGMRLMLWLEPERAIVDTKMTKLHPDWFIFNDKTSLLLNLGNEEAKKYVRDLLIDYAKSLELSCYRQDFNIDPAKYFSFNDKEDRQGITEIKHIMGMYEVWDDLLKAVPGIIIDNCASGGRRIDIETLKRSIPFFRTDYQCNFDEEPEVLQTQTSNISQYLPYNGCTTNTKNDTYAIRSSYSSSWGNGCYHAIFLSMEDQDFKWLKKVTDEYRKIRKYMTKDFYNLGSSVFDKTSWTVWQYNDKETKSGIVMAFRKSQSPFDSIKIDLKGLALDKEYEITNIDDSSTQNIKNTLEISLPQKRSSVIFEYKIK